MEQKKFEALKKAIIALDAFLTGKDKMAAHMMQSQESELRREMDEQGDYIYYLADGGMSRIVLKFHPQYEKFINPTVFYTSNSMPEVKERWKEEDAQDLIHNILDLMFEPDQDMVAQFKTEISDRPDEIDPNQEYDWYAITLGWAIAKGLSPYNAHTFSLYIRYSTELG